MAPKNVHRFPYPERLGRGRYLQRRESACMTDGEYQACMTAETESACHRIANTDQDAMGMST